MPTAYGGDWQNFQDWLNSPQGILFYVFLGGLIISILANLVVYVLGGREREWEESSRGRILGRFLAVTGGFIVLVATLLPWVGYGGSAVSYSVRHGVVANGVAGVLVYMFGFLWLTWFAIPRKLCATLGFAWGGVALLLTLNTIAWIASLSMSGFYIESGAYVSIVGSLILIGGSALAYVKARRTVSHEPILFPTS